jgi:hypothetical protein
MAWSPNIFGLDFVRNTLAPNFFVEPGPIVNSFMSFRGVKDNIGYNTWTDGPLPGIFLPASADNAFGQAVNWISAELPADLTQKLGLPINDGLNSSAKWSRRVGYQSKAYEQPGNWNHGAEMYVAGKLTHQTRLCIPI